MSDQTKGSSGRTLKSLFGTLTANGASKRSETTGSTPSQVAPGSADAVYADRIVSALKYPMAPAWFDFDGWWNDAAQAVGAVIPARETAPDSADRTPPAGR